ncbi:MAG: methylated-DNA--[protein]-cysteine S-methyltransferase [Bacteroidota bacterium]
METAYCTSFQSSIGTIYVASTDRGICKISLPRETKKDFIAWLHQHFDDYAVVESRSKNKTLIDELSRYFKRRLVQFTLPLDDRGTPFQRKVWRELLRVPYGRTITYKELARRVGAPKAYRAIGQALHANPLPILVPCHRVIGSDGSLKGYTSGVKTKEFLLRLEGALML